MAIDIQISQQNYELITTAIGSILATELAEQTYCSDLGVVVWNERVIPFQLNELPAVNVTYDRASYDNHDATSRRGENKFFIDVHVKSYHTDNDDADKLAAVKAKRIAGIIMYILQAPEYVTLGFSPGIIHNRRVESMDIGRLSNQDSLHTVVARIGFIVTASETQAEIEGTEMEILSTQVMLGESDEGYYFELTN